MSFFGLETNHDVLEKEKEKFLESGLAAQDDVAVFNWGESDYDGLGEALQEGGDDMNDETFGDGPVGASICPQLSARYLLQSQARTLTFRIKKSLT